MAANSPVRRRWGAAARLGVVVVLLTLLAALGIVHRSLRDRHQYVDAQRLGAALKIFRPAGRAGLPTTVDAGSLRPDRSTRTSPERCRGLALLNTVEVLDGGSWSGINGTPAQPVSTLTIRLASANAARAELRRKRLALLTCPEVVLTFPPFDEPALPFTVRGRIQPALLAGNSLSYTLVGQDYRYTFYVRRYGNTLSWTYGAAESQPAVRQEVVDDLAATLADLAAQ